MYRALPAISYDYPSSRLLDLDLEGSINEMPHPWGRNEPMDSTPSPVPIEEGIYLPATYYELEDARASMHSDTASNLHLLNLHPLNLHPQKNRWLVGKVGWSNAPYIDRGHGISPSRRLSQRTRRRETNGD